MLEIEEVYGVLDCSSPTVLKWVFAALLMVTPPKWGINCGFLELAVKDAWKSVQKGPRFYEKLRVTGRKHHKTLEKYLLKKRTGTQTASRQASENNLPHQAQLNGIIKAPQLALLYLDKTTIR